MGATANIAHTPIKATYKSHNMLGSVEENWC